MGRGFAEAAFIRRVGFSRRGELGRRATIKIGSALLGCAGLLRLRRRRRLDRLGIKSMCSVISLAKARDVRRSRFAHLRTLG